MGRVLVELSDAQFYKHQTGHFANRIHQFWMTGYMPIILNDILA